MANQEQDEQTITHQAEVHGRRVLARDRSIENEGVSWSVDEPALGKQFESLRTLAIFDLDEFIRFQRQHSARYPDRSSELRTTTVVDGSNLEDSPLEVTRDQLRMELRSMISMIERIQYAEWSYRSFPYVPYSLLYVCGFALAQDLERNANSAIGALSSSFRAPSQGSGDPSRSASRRRAEQNISEIVWRATADAERISFLRAILLAGLGVSSIWSVYRSLRFGIIVWCRQSLKALVKKLDSNEITEEDSDWLNGFKWSVLWWINTML